MKTIITDGGRSTSSHKNEKLDCTVRALALTTAFTYDEAHAHMRGLGRKDRKRHKGWGVVCKAFGKSCKRSGSVGKFSKDHPVGKFVIQMRGHVFAMIDGDAYDNKEMQAGCHVKRAWKIS